MKSTINLRNNKHLFFLIGVLLFTPSLAYLASTEKYEVISGIDTYPSPPPPNKDEILLNHETFIPEEKVRIGVIEDANTPKKLFTIKIGTTTLFTEIKPDVTVYLGNGEKAKVEDIKDGMKVYLFGYLKNDNTSMLVSKIVIANKSRLDRSFVYASLKVK